MVVGRIGELAERYWGLEVIVPYPDQLGFDHVFFFSFSTVNVQPNCHKNIFDKKEFVCSSLGESTNEHHRIETNASS